MFALKKLLAALLLPPTSLLLLALLAVLMIRRWPRLGRTTAVLSLGVLLLLSMPWTGNRLLASLETAPVISAAQLSSVQAIVVLGGGATLLMPEYGAEQLNATSLERVRYAAHLYRQHARPILVSGGAVVSSSAEASLMQQTLRRDFLTPVRWVEADSLDTADNARLSAEMLRRSGVERIALVSHAWHLRRAVPLFERAGLQVVPAPTLGQRSAFSWMDLLPGNGLTQSRQALHEWLGIFANWLAAAY